MSVPSSSRSNIRPRACATAIYSATATTAEQTRAARSKLAVAKWASPNQSYSRPASLSLFCRRWSSRPCQWRYAERGSPTATIAVDDEDGGGDSEINSAPAPVSPCVRGARVGYYISQRTSAACEAVSGWGEQRCSAVRGRWAPTSPLGVCPPRARKVSRRRRLFSGDLVWNGKVLSFRGGPIRCLCFSNL